jgi:phosphogluconate dehydratase
LLVRVPADVFAARSSAVPDPSHRQHGFGRELFGAFRQAVGPADTGASVLF